jgi:transposase
MPGKSKLTADAAEQAALRALSKSEQRGEADRARAILLTLEGRQAGEIATVLGVHVSTVRNWRGYFAHGGAAGLRRRPRLGGQSVVGLHAGAIAATILTEDTRRDGGWTLPGVFRSEVEALNFIRRQVPQGTTLYADAAGPWNELYSRYTLHRVNHEEACSLGGEHDINTNAAESFFSRMRRGEIGHHHHVAGPYLLRFAQEAAWRENYRRVRTAARLTGSWRWRCTTSRASISAVIGSAAG